MDFHPSAGSDRRHLRLVILLLSLWVVSLFGCYQPSASLSPQVTVDTLMRLLQDRDVVIRRTAAESLGKIGDHRAVPGLILALGDSSSVVREVAVHSLSQFGPLERADGECVARLLMDPIPAVRTSAAQTLTSLDGMKELWPVAAGHLNHEDPDVRRTVIQALEGVNSPEVLSALAIKLHDLDPPVRRAAVVSLAES